MKRIGLDSSTTEESSVVQKDVTGAHCETNYEFASIKILRSKNSTEGWIIDLLSCHLYRDNKQIISNEALVAVTILTAESNPNEMEIIVKLITNLLQ